MPPRTLIVCVCAAALNGVCASLLTAPAADPLVRFWRDNDGKSVRRLSVDVVPENVFWGFGTRDFPDGLKAFSRMIDESVAKSTYNCVTLTLRCNPELGDKETLLAVQAVNEKSHAAGIKVYMDTDPRIARREFFARWPNEMQGVAVVASETAVQSRREESRDGHMDRAGAVVFGKATDRNRGKERYTFYDGSPFATVVPHYGHLLAGTIKDIVPRYQTKRGKYVERRLKFACDAKSFAYRIRLR